MRHASPIVLILALALQGGGCAAIFNGGPHRVTVITSPEGETVFFEGRSVADGETISVSRDFDAPRLNVGTARRPILVEMSWDPDPLLIVDCALLLLGIVPGLVALGIDFGTGAWRDLEPTQHVNVPEPSP